MVRNSPYTRIQGTDGIQRWLDQTAVSRPSGRSHGLVRPCWSCGERFRLPCGHISSARTILTHVSVVRVNQIEVLPLVRSAKTKLPTIARITSAHDEKHSREAAPDGRMTWAISWLALNDDRQQYKDARRLLASYHDKYGDEITFIPGGYFAPMYDTREHNQQTIHKALHLISDMVGNGYRPQSLVAGFMDAENQQIPRHRRGHPRVPGADLEPARHRSWRRRRRHLLSVLPQPRALSETRAGCRRTSSTASASMAGPVTFSQRDGRAFEGKLQ